MTEYTPGVQRPPAPPHRPATPQRSTGPSLSTLKAIVWALVVVDVVLIGIAIAMAAQLFSGPSSNQVADDRTPAASSPAPDSEPDGSESQEPDAEDLADITGAETFTTPTGNIICTISSTGVVCSIAKLNDTPQENPNGCEGFIGYVVELRSSGTTLPCIPKAELPVAAGDGIEVLEYGDSKTVNNFVCESSNTGMVCEDSNSERGFKLARAGITTH